MSRSRLPALSFKPGFEFLHVGMGIAKAGGFAEANAVDEAGMIQRIADDGVSFIQQCFEEAGIGIKT